MEKITPPMPAKRAMAVLDEPPPAEPINKALRIITHKVRRGVAALVDGECKTIKAAAELAGLAPESLSRALDKPHVIEHLRQKVIRRLGIAAARAGAVKGELLDSASEIVRDRASSFVLGLAGIAPAASPSLSVNIEIKAGYVIDLTDEQSPMRIVSGTTPSAAVDHDHDGPSAS
jgi:uncharacterized protein (DUF1778 family)